MGELMRNAPIRTKIALSERNMQNLSIMANYLSLLKVLIKIGAGMN